MEDPRPLSPDRAPDGTDLNEVIRRVLLQGPKAQPAERKDVVGLSYYDYFFSEFPRRPLHVDSLIQLRNECTQVSKPQYREELKRVFSLFHPPAWAEKHFQTWIEALFTACLDPDHLEEDFKKNGSEAVLAKLWSDLYGPAKGTQAKKAFETWLRTLISILRDQDRLCFETTCHGGPSTLMVEIIEDEDEEVAIYDERDSSRAAYGSVGARLKILDDDQPLEVAVPWDGLSRLPTPYLLTYQLRLPEHKLRLPEHKPCYLESGLWYSNAFFQDFPSRAIMANNRAEIDEEWSKVQFLDYRHELRRIFNVFHVKWSLIYGKDLMADKHLTTWLKALEYAHTFPEMLHGINDHSVRYVFSMFIAPCS